MSLAPWRSSLARALHRNRSLPYARYFQLATLRQDGRPANRTVVFRGFLEETNQLLTVTDQRSEKAEQVRYSPWAEACWYFPQTREQFRITGTLELVSADDVDSPLQAARQRAWQTLSDAARVQFAWAHPREARAAATTFSPPQPSATEPLTTFSLLVLDPTQVDHLELRGDPQNRWLYQLQGEAWSIAAVNP